MVRAAIALQQWSLNTQYEFIEDMILDARYVGSRGVGLPGRVNLSQPIDPRVTPANGFTNIYNGTRALINLDFFVAPEFLLLSRDAGFRRLSNWAHSNYHAMQLQMRERFRSSANWNVAYTFRAVDGVVNFSR